jgi:hypothetical protein
MLLKHLNMDHMLTHPENFKSSHIYSIKKKLRTRFNMELVVTSAKACKNVSMANISNIRSISFVSKYKLKFSICPKFLTFSNVLNDNAAILSAEDNFVWILSNEDPFCVRELAKFIHWCFQMAP